MIKKIKLSDVDKENTFYHFTKQIGLQNIFVNGLEATIGENSVGVEESPKVFFAQGDEGELKICDVWIKWLMNKEFGFNGLRRQYEGEELYSKANLWNKEFTERTYLKDTEKKSKIFEEMFEYMRQRAYLMLDLKEKIDFSFDDVDDAKQFALTEKIQGRDSKYKYMKEFYGNYGNADIDRVEKFNLHTFPYKSVEPEKITQIISSNGNEDALSILLEIYERCPKKDIHFDLLDEFIEFSKDKLKTANKIENPIHYTDKELQEHLIRNGIRNFAKQEEIAMEKENAIEMIDILDRNQDKSLE